MRTVPAALLLGIFVTGTLIAGQVKQAARGFIENHLGANDLVAVVFTGGDAAAQAFTSSRPLLLAAVDKFVGHQLPSSTLAANATYHAQIEIADANTKGGSTASSIPSGSADDAAAELWGNAQSTLSTLRQVGQWISSLRGRRQAILLFSEGIGYDLTNLVDDPSSTATINGRERTFTAMRETLAATMRSNVSIYGIDPRGLSTTADETIAVSGFADQSDPRSGIGLS